MGVYTRFSRLMVLGVCEWVGGGVEEVVFREGEGNGITKGECIGD